MQDVARIGKRFEVQDVPDGHALNFLIPRGMAKPATPENVKQLERRKEKTDADRAIENAEFKNVCEKLAESTVTLTLPANEQGHLFKSVNESDVALAVSTEIGKLSAEHVIIGAPIKSVGEHKVEVRSGDEGCSFTLAVTAA